MVVESTWYRKTSTTEFHSEINLKKRISVIREWPDLLMAAGSTYHRNKSTIEFLMTLYKIQKMYLVQESFQTTLVPTQLDCLPSLIIIQWVVIKARLLFNHPNPLNLAILQNLVETLNTSQASPQAAEDLVVHKIPQSAIAPDKTKISKSSKPSTIVQSRVFQKIWISIQTCLLSFWRTILC